MNDTPEPIHHNAPQLAYMAVNARISVLKWGRATGKTEIGAWKVSSNMNSMPRSSNSIASFSYTNMLSKLIPGVIRSLEKYGYRENVHFWFNQFPPKGSNIPKGFRPIQTSQNVLFWWNGSYTQLLSTRSLANAMEADSHWFDEARFLPYDKVKEILLTTRGSKQHFGHLSDHGSILISSDQPQSPDQEWFYDYKEQMDPKLIKLIMQYSIYLSQLKLEAYQGSFDRARLMQAEINKVEEVLTKLRKKAVYFSEADTLENVHALGLDTIWNYYKLLDRRDFVHSVLNKKVGKPENSFYALFSKVKHCYISENETYLHDLEIDWKDVMPDCTWQTDIVKGKPLEISCDANVAIMTMVVSQARRVAGKDADGPICAMHVEHPKKIADLVQKFDNYFKPHKLSCSIINFWYDHTFVAETPMSDISIKDEFIKEFSKKGWTVRPIYVGQAPGYDSRYYLWQDTFLEKSSSLPAFRANQLTCEDLIESMSQTKTIPGRKGYVKEKKKERQWKKVNQVHQPHYGEAMDVYWAGKYLNKLRPDTNAVYSVRSK